MQAHSPSWSKLRYRLNTIIILFWPFINIYQYISALADASITPQRKNGSWLEPGSLETVPSDKRKASKPKSQIWFRICFRIACINRELSTFPLKSYYILDWKIRTDHKLHKTHLQTVTEAWEACEVTVHQETERKREKRGGKREFIGLWGRLRRPCLHFQPDSH